MAELLVGLLAFGFIGLCIFRFGISMRRRAQKIAESVKAEPQSDESVDDLVAAAMSGDSDAMLTLAGLYAGPGAADDDYARAFDWCSRALEAGNREAVLPLATMYRRGRGVERDERKAFELYEQAAGEGSVDAMLSVAEMLGSGAGVAEERAAAAQWVARAEVSAMPEHLTRIGRMYLTGEAVGQDFNKAREYFESAGKPRPVYLDLYAGSIVRTPDPFAMIELGRMHAKGQGVPIDLERALDIYAQAAKTDDPEALLALSEMFEHGDCAPHDHGRADALKQRAVENGAIPRD